MSVSRDPDRLISAYLEDGIDELSDDSYEAVRSQIDHTRQRVVFGPWKEEQMRRYAIFGIAAAVIVLVAVVGIRFLPGNGGLAGPPAVTPSPQPTSSQVQTQSPNPSPSPTVFERLWSSVGSGLVPAGSYWISGSGSDAINMSRLTFTLPGGWTRADVVAKDPGTNSEVLLDLWTVTDIFADACKWDEANLVNVGTTADEFVNAIANQKSHTASAVTDTTIDGYPAKEITLTVAPILDTATCTDGVLRFWPGPGPNFSGGMCCDLTGNIDTLYAVDVNGKRTVIIARHYPGSSSQSLAELQSIVDSIQIEP